MLVVAITPALAHSSADLDQWVDEWKQDWPPTVEAIEEWQEMADRHPCYFTNQCQAVNPRSNAGVFVADVGAGVERWRPLVEKYFPSIHVEWALEIMSCESGGNPNAVGPTNDHGLFQHVATYWADRSTRAGWAGANIYDPEANIAVAAWLLATGGKGHWVCVSNK